jgi:UPF0755 protein
MEETKKQNVFFRLFKLIIWIAVIWWIIIYNNYSNFKTKTLITENKIIEIKSWENLKDLAKKINVNYYFLKQYTSDKKLKLLKWRFEIKKDSKIDDILKSLEKPLPEKQVNVTILEWWNIFDIDDYLTKKWYINKWDYIKYVQNPEKIKSLSKFYKFISPNFQTLEWFLYPDSYKLKFPIQINKLVIKQLDNFEEKVYNKILLNKNSEEILKIINLASIVEKEEKSNFEKPTVAGILKKRLENNWNIWADITVCYPHKLTANECKMVVSKYIKEKSQYNTRTMIWLPITPIWNPSFETINATLNYKKTPYWYYLHNTKTGKIYYWKTNTEHEQNKKYMY